MLMWLSCNYGFSFVLAWLSRKMRLLLCAPLPETRMLLNPEGDGTGLVTDFPMFFPPPSACHCFDAQPLSLLTKSEAHARDLEVLPKY